MSSSTEYKVARASGRTPAIVALSLLAPWLGGCGGAAVSTATAPSAAPESVWAALQAPRPTPLAGAVRLAVGEFLLLQENAWGIDGALLSAQAGVQELVSTGLLRRRDVHFVERRRFAAAVERERLGRPARANAPPIGESVGAEFLLQGSWMPLGGQAVLDMRLTDIATSEVVEGWRVMTPKDADPTSLSRTVIVSLMGVLDGRGQRPSWRDPLGTPAPDEYQESDVPVGAVAAYMRGISAEDRFDWEAARRAYSTAAEVGGVGFFEADVALARIARLRAGGSLANSD